MFYKLTAKLWNLKGIKVLYPILRWNKIYDEKQRPSP